MFSKVSQIFSLKENRRNGDIQSKVRFGVSWGLYFLLLFQKVSYSSDLILS